MRAWKKTTDQDRDARTAHILNHMLDVHGVREFSSDTPRPQPRGDVTHRGLRCTEIGRSRRRPHGHNGGISPAAVRAAHHLCDRAPAAAYEKY